MALKTEETIRINQLKESIEMIWIEEKRIMEASPFITMNGQHDQWQP